MTGCKTPVRDGVCYWDDDLLLTYKLAQEQCGRDNGTLAMPLDQETVDFIT